jgi:hypothetical protein
VIKRAAALLLVTLVATPAFADFDAIARAISRKSGVRRVWIPFLGLARFAVRIAAPEGVHDFQLATFEGGNRLDPKELKALMRSQAGKGFVPLVQVWSRKSGEWSFIYVKPSPSGKRMELLVLAHDKSDTTLVRVDVDAALIARELDSPRQVTRVASR